MRSALDYLLILLVLVTLVVIGYMIYRWTVSTNLPYNDPEPPVSGLLVGGWGGWPRRGTARPHRCSDHLPHCGGWLSTFTDR